MTIWPSFARKRVRRPRPSTSTCAQYICCAGRCKRAPLRSRISLLHPQRPRAAASSGAAAAGQETSRSPAQRGRRPPAVLRGARRKAGPRATGGWLSSACTARLAALPARAADLDNLQLAPVCILSQPNRMETGARYEYCNLISRISQPTFAKMARSPNLLGQWRRSPGGDGPQIW